MTAPVQPDGPRLPRPSLRPDMTVRQVAADYPACKDVFLRHGEPDGRPTKFGHLEPLDHFARRHGIPLNQLLEELASTAGVGIDRSAEAAGQAHRPFVAAALTITLTLGAGWGAWLLFEIGRRGTFAAASTGDVVAHGEAQLWGFVVLFIVGIALRFLPMTTARPRASRAFRAVLLMAFLWGVAGGFAWALAPADWPWLGPASGAGLAAAALGFLAFVVRQVGANFRPVWARLVLAAAAWLAVWGVATLALRTVFSPDGPGGYGEPARLLLIELAVFGFALNAVYGFGQKLLSGFLGSATPRRGWIEAAFWLHNLGVAAFVLAWAVQAALPSWLGSAALATGAALYAAGMRGFRRVRRTPPRPELGERFLDRYVQLAFFWLLAGLALVVAADLCEVVSGSRPGHAWLGAARHALTVGFLTTLMIGVGQRLLPVLGHTLLAWPRLVVPTFVLISLGNLIRVTTELATLAFPWAYPLMPASAVLELTALALFTTNALRTMWPARDSLLRTGQATTRTPVALLLAEYPWLEDRLYEWGIGYVGRVRAVPAELTLGTLATTEGHDAEEIVGRVNTLLRQARQEGSAAAAHAQNRA